jgi:hypothetical protein
MEEALKLLGLGPAFIYGAAVFAFFKFLDAKASPEAKIFITNQFRRHGYNNAQFATAMLELFDRLYSRPLFSIKAFLRSATFSILVALVLYSVMYWDGIVFAITHSQALSEISNLTINLLANVVIDYLSLFFVRRCLTVIAARPIAASIIAPLVGVFVIFLLIQVRAIAKGPYDRESLLFELSLLLNPGVLYFFVFNDPYFIAAGLVHAWLPLFATGVLAIWAMNSLLWATAKTQWFLSDGASHPLEAIGFVVGPFVFVGVAISRVLLGS